MSLLDDAVELVYWYESQPDCGTYRNDEKIALALGWRIGGGRFAPVRRGAQGLQPPGDAARVRRARNYVDKNNETQPFLGYQFGTKRNGAGVRFSMLHTPNMGNALAAVDESTSEQLGRAVQQTTQAAAERARMVAKLGELEASYFKAGKFEQAVCVHDAAKELQMFGQLTMATLQEARRLGILERISGQP